jgi:hypothetical protein
MHKELVECFLVYVEGALPPLKSLLQQRTAPLCIRFLLSPQMNQSCPFNKAKFYQIFTLGKDLERGCSGNLSPTSCRVLILRADPFLVITLHTMYHGAVFCRNSKLYHSQLILYHMLTPLNWVFLPYSILRNSCWVHQTHCHFYSLQLEFGAAQAKFVVQQLHSTVEPGSCQFVTHFHISTS